MSRRARGVLPSRTRRRRRASFALNTSRGGDRPRPVDGPTRLSPSGSDRRLRVRTPECLIQSADRWRSGSGRATLTSWNQDARLKRDGRATDAARAASRFIVARAGMPDGCGRLLPAASYSTSLCPGSAARLKARVGIRSARRRAPDQRREFPPGSALGETLQIGADVLEGGQVRAIAASAQFDVGGDDAEHAEIARSPPRKPAAFESRLWEAAC